MITEPATEVHIYWKTVEEWCHQTRFYGQITITFEAGIPMKINVPDGIGVRSVLIKDIRKELIKK